ncbi:MULTISPECIES: hypothetical protein [Methylobacterium]|uniref:Uncharacterized protein n=1 Tax=Methylobacterium longum TaxID=767694 RepID=A0ABT8AS07_9HYPH|nr:MULTISPECIES: hypothetical protein [Methylobacterium]MCJ2099177.1 hypothetical protein [Methylobacterium sp. E-046]MDN3572717.1 hypothetical protein [Methylobacterium longum]GJE10160.1 hypothetical protein FOHLNKBM_1192 [Methylobacterium longum]
MAGRVPDQSVDGPDGAGAPEAERSDDRTWPAPEAGRDAAEREKAETEIAAGDVADDLADFA